MTYSSNNNNIGKNNGNENNKKQFVKIFTFFMVKAKIAYVSLHRFVSIVKLN
jgi:hypothetical protein